MPRSGVSPAGAFYTHAVRAMSDWIEVIPGVLIHKDCDLRSEMNRLFPLPFYANLRRRYPQWFEGVE